MKSLILIITILYCHTGINAQTDLQRLFDAERSLADAVAEIGSSQAFPQFLAEDSIIFRPDAVNGKAFWMARPGSSPERLVRRPTYADIGANGLIGYTTGTWELFTKGSSATPTEFGHYVTVWLKKPDDKYRANLDITIKHEKPDVAEPPRAIPGESRRDLNEKGWSAADPSMNFLKLAMTKKALGGAYAKFAAEDVRLLRDGEPPIIGKKSVVSETHDYKSIDYPKKVALLESADIAYVWNPCEFVNSEEGKEKGNCLQIWKLRNEKWWIVLGVVSRVRIETKPTIKIKQK